MSGELTDHKLAVDGCPYTFSELASTVLPGLMSELAESMRTPVAMKRIADDSVATTVRRLGLGEDFPGCYVLLEASRPVYVGISRKVVNRLRQHVRSDTHNSATLAYSMAKTQTGCSMWREDAMKDREFVNVFDERRDYLRSLSAAFVRIDNPLERHVFEAYAAQELRTGKWNTFETH